MRLRPLSEAECYARCYGGRRDEAVSSIDLPADYGWGSPFTDEQLDHLFSDRATTEETEKEAA